MTLTGISYLEKKVNDEHDDVYVEPVCTRCGSPDCDGVKNCEVCGEDTDCDKEFCINCVQDHIEEITNDPDFDPSYKGAC